MSEDRHRQLLRALAGIRDERHIPPVVGAFELSNLPVPAFTVERDLRGGFVRVVLESETPPAALQPSGPSGPSPHRAGLPNQVYDALQPAGATAVPNWCYSVASTLVAESSNLLFDVGPVRVEADPGNFIYTG